MTDKSIQSRRTALKFLSGMPIMLPFGSVAAASLLSACGGGGGEDPAPVTPPVAPVEPAPAPTYLSASFGTMEAPSLANPAAMATTSVGSSLTVTMSDGSTQSFKLAYEPFFTTGDLVSDGANGLIRAGGYFDINNQPIVDRSVPLQPRQFFSDAPDGTSLIALENAAVAGIKGKAVFAVVQFEYTSKNRAGASDVYGQLPSPIAILTLDQDQATGQLTLVKYHNVDTSSVKGLWITCGASLSPWNTHLSSEEYEPDAFALPEFFSAYAANLYGAANAARAKAYHYGHMPEITVNPDGTGSIKKHYCMGRISHELVQMMPDSRTALQGDDYTNGGLFMFVADVARDLSAGTLYVARFGAGFTLNPADAGAAVSWIRLGHATSAEIENLANTLAPTDIMTVSFANPNDPTFTRMFCDGVEQWVKVKPGMEKAAAFLETHRYANIVGGSMAFTKMEGTTVNVKDKIAYSALANIQASMVAGNRAHNPAYNITVPKQVLAGGVLAHNLAGGQVDTAGAAIVSDWVPVMTKTLLVGTDLAAPDALGNVTDPANISSPDNIKFSEKMRTLFIGEDSSHHVNNFLWAYNVDTRSLTRIMSIPAGGEATGLHAVDEINGWTYIMSNFQHAGAYTSGTRAEVKAALTDRINANYKDGYGAAVGYMTADSAQFKLGKV
jgi:secreted PhoX family phosphatase